jgi:hypothetical protein
MSDNKKEPTNGGSKYTIVGGQINVDERANELKMPPEGAMKIKLPQDEKDFISIPLVQDQEIER